MTAGGIRTLEEPEALLSSPLFSSPLPSPCLVISAPPSTSLHLPVLSSPLPLSCCLCTSFYFSSPPSWPNLWRPSASRYLLSQPRLIPACYLLPPPALLPLSHASLTPPPTPLLTCPMPPQPAAPQVSFTGVSGQGNSLGYWVKYHHSHNCLCFLVVNLHPPPSSLLLPLSFILLQRFPLSILFSASLRFSVLRSGNSSRR